MVIKSLQEGKSYKYLGILEVDKFLEEKMKLNVWKKYIRRIRKVLKSKLNGGNLVHGVNTWAVSLLRYSAAWLQNGDLKRDTESLIVAAQNQSIRTNLVKARIDKSQGDSLCRMCRKVDESIDHIVSGCSKLAQKEYKRRHDNLGKIVHWKLARKCNFDAGDKWYEHEPESLLENEDYKILWDFSIQTDHVIETRRPDLVVVDKKERSCKIIDFAVPGDSRIEEEEKDKIEKYQELGRELQKIWNVKVKIIPLVVDFLGAIPTQFGNRLKQIGIAVGTAQVQKTVLLGTARILRKVLEI